MSFLIISVSREAYCVAISGCDVEMAVSYLARRDLMERSVVYATVNLGGIITVFLVFSSVLNVQLKPWLAGIVVLLLSLLVLSTGTLTTRILLFSGRKREIAVLRALGAKRTAVWKICIAESILMGLIASMLGTLFGMIILLGLKSLMEISFSRDLVLLAIFLGVAATMTSGIYSTRKAIGAEIGDALRYERW